MARNADDSLEGPKVSLIDSSVAEDSDGNYAYEINGEFIANGFEKNTLRHEIVSRSRKSIYQRTQKSRRSSGDGLFHRLRPNNFPGRTTDDKIWHPRHAARQRERHDDG